MEEVNDATQEPNQVFKSIHGVEAMKRLAVTTQYTGNNSSSQVANALSPSKVNKNKDEGEFDADTTPKNLRDTDKHLSTFS